MKSQYLMETMGAKASDHQCSRQQMEGEAWNLTRKWRFAQDKRLGFEATRVGLVSQCQPSGGLVARKAIPPSSLYSSFLEY